MPFYAPSADFVLNSADCNEFSEEKERFMRIIEDKMEKKMTGAFWAACMVADVEKLEEMAAQQPTYLNNHPWLIEQAMCLWAQKPFEENEQMAGDESHEATMNEAEQNDSNIPKEYRNAAARRRARERDGHCCVLTGIKQLQVAHIYPHSGLKSTKAKVRDRAWNTYKYFWRDDKVDQWRSAVDACGLQQPPMEQCRNLISLNSVAHVWWNDGLFSIKPDECGDGWVVGQHFWQEQYQHNAKDIMPKGKRPESSRGINHETIFLTRRPAPGGAPVLIETGDKFIMRADAKSPEPNYWLLNMAWHMQRVMAMRGAADNVLDSDDDSDDEEQVALQQKQDRARKA